MLELADIQLTALDSDPLRARRVGEQLQRLNLTATVIAADCRDSSQWDGLPYDRILADVPCSASGVARRHPDIKECLLARQRAVALLPWHLQPEDEHDPTQKQLVADLTSIVERTHRWVELRRNLMEAIWYGKGFVQLRYGVKQVKGRWRKVAADWEPRHPDKILRATTSSRAVPAEQAEGVLAIEVEGVSQRAQRVLVFWLLHGLCSSPRRMRSTRSISCPLSAS
jgi:hypothetical protein